MIVPKLVPTNHLRLDLGSIHFQICVGARFRRPGLPTSIQGKIIIQKFFKEEEEIFLFQISEDFEGPKYKPYQPNPRPWLVVIEVAKNTCPIYIYIYYICIRYIYIRYISDI